MYRHLLVFILSFFYSLTAGAQSAQQSPREVGQTDFVKGKVMAIHPGLDPRSLIRPKQGIFLQDFIETGDASFSVLEFLDKAKCSVRPLSRFSVEEYALASLKASLKLDQGGVEVQMGEIGEQTPNELVLKTPVAEVSAQQGHFRVRICTEDCAKEHKDNGQAAAPSQEVVARVTEATGKVLAIGKAVADGPGMQRRQLALGAPLYRQDELTTGDASSAMLLFRDGGRVGLGANSALEIKDYRWQEPGHDSHFALRLVRGGLRSVTGTLGQSAPKAYSIETPVSMVGIRGTVFDLLLDEAGQGAEPALYSFVHQGEVELTGASEPLVLHKEQGSRLQGGAAESVAAIPGDAALIGNNPQQVKMDLVGDFGRHPLAGAPPGLYVYAVDGHVRIKGQNGTWAGRMLHLGRGEAAFVDPQGALMRLDRPRDFQLQDAVEQASQSPVLPLAPVAVLPPPQPPAPPASPLAKKPLPPPPKPTGCPPGTSWSKAQRTCVAKATGCPAGQYYSKRTGRCQVEARPVPKGCPRGTYYSKRHNGCVREEEPRQKSSGASTAVKAAVGVAIAVGIIKALSGGKSHSSGGHSSGCCK